MLVQFESRYIPTNPVMINIMMSSAIPICVGSERGKEELSVGHESHNNGGYTKVQGSKHALLAKLASAGAKMASFRTAYGEIHLNISKSIPLAVSQDKVGCVLSYPTHNNGGYKVSESMDNVVRKIEEALALEVE